MEKYDSVKEAEDVRIATGGSILTSNYETFYVVWLSKTKVLAHPDLGEWVLQLAPDDENA